MCVATWKYTNIEQTSTTVVISGAAIIAGSNFNFFANSGNVQPITLDITTVAINVIPNTIESCMF